MTSWEAKHQVQLAKWNDKVAVQVRTVREREAGQKRQRRLQQRSHSVESL